ncbi:MAG: TetR/AcrR family transcriptional regulator [Candidatus Binataceae bacterium]
MTRAAPPTERSQLTVEEIVQAAMDLLERDGIDRLTIRALASRLGVAPGALYYYFKDKEELLQRLGETIFNAVPAPPRGTWQKQLRAHIKDIVATFSRFPGSDALARSADPWRWAQGKATPTHVMLAQAGFAGEALRLAEKTVTIFMSGALRIADIEQRRGAPRFAKSADLDAAIDTLIAGLTTRVRAARS